MPKMRYRDYKEPIEAENLTARRFYESKYFGLFMNAYKFTNLSYNQSRYMLKKLWKNGTVCAFILEGSRKEPTLKEALTNTSKNTVSVGFEEDKGLIIFCPYAVQQWNIEDEPAVVTYVNTRGATFIPNTPKIVNKDCVIGWAHTSHMPVVSLVRYYVDRIVDVENTIETNLFVHKLPRLVICSPQDRERVKNIVEAIERGEHKLFLDVDDWQAVKNVLESGQGSYIIDKLYLYKQNLENELLSFLGINNIQIEKKERLITDEAESNNQLINDSSDCFLDSLKDFCKLLSSVLDYEVTVEAKSSPQSNEEFVEDDEGGNEDDAD